MKQFILIAILLGFSATAQEKITLYFDFDVYELNDLAIEKLTDVITTRKMEVSKIYGYCDWKGSNAYNDSLSLKRVNSVFEFLVAKGINIREGYEVKGFGEDFEQSKIQAANRKVLVIFDEVKQEKVSDKEITIAEKVKLAKVGDKIRLNNINFHNNSAVVVQRSQPVLYDLLCALEENPNLKIEIQGHICCQLRSDSNDVSTSRARAIYNFLIRNKIDRKRLTYKGFGITQPLFAIPEKNDAEADENRRVEIMIVEN